MELNVFQSIAIYLVLLFGIVACATEPPTPFAVGEEVAPPIGCVVLRQERPDADC